MRCYIKSSTSSRVHSQEADEEVDRLAEGISQFHDQFEALFKRYRSSASHAVFVSIRYGLGKGVGVGSTVK